MATSPLPPALIILALSGCAKVSYVARSEDGGTLALRGQRAGAMKRARELMLEHCRGPYQILNDQASADDAWRLTYRCGGTKSDPTVAVPDGDGYTTPAEPNPPK